MNDLFEFEDLEPEHIICPTTGKKLNPNTLLPIEDHTSFKYQTLNGDIHLCCEGFDGPCDNKAYEPRHKGTKYVDDELNYVVQCDECYEKELRYWADMWSEYYSDCF